MEPNNHNNQYGPEGPLIKALRDESVFVPGLTADAQAHIGSDEAIEHLIKALQDEESSIRVAAAEALGKVGGDEAIEHLKRVLGDEDAGVRYTAAEALRRASGSKKEAAVLLGIPRQSLYRYITGEQALIETAAPA